MTTASPSASSSSPNACILCECNCGVQITLGGDDGRNLVKIRGDKAHPSSKGYTCEKAQRLDHYQNGRDRLTTPLKRQPDGSFAAIGWDEALDEVATRLAAIRDEHGGTSILYYGGGGQGNHLPGAYATATRATLGSRYRSNALAQEKTGEFWVCGRTFGSATRADFEHCDVALFLGKNPWHSHSIPRARITLKAIAKDPSRTLIVVDPRRTKSAELADIHLQVRPGGDAWLLGALLAVLVEDGRTDEAFVSTKTFGFDTLEKHLGKVSVAAYCQRAGVDEALVRRAADAIASAKAFSSFEDLGVQMNRQSTLVSYLHRLLIALTGSVGRPGTHYVPTPLVNFTGGASGRTSPVTDAPIIGGLIPCNSIPAEILTDHPKRFRAMLCEAANPAHSLADTVRMKEAIEALDFVVVLDVAMSETAELADIVLPCATQYEKAEATFFNFEFPENVFQLRPRLLEPPEGRLSEAEIHARLAERLGALTEEDYAPLREAAKGGLASYVGAFMAHAMADARLMKQVPVLLYRTLDLPDDRREGAVLLGLVMRLAMQHGKSLAAAGFKGTPLDQTVAVFDAMVNQPSGVVFAVDQWDDVLPRVGVKDGKIDLALPDLLEAFDALADDLEWKADADFPLVLAAGERRSGTTNTIIRDRSWARLDDVALRISPQDAAQFGLSDGDRARLVTKRGSAVVPVHLTDSLRPGHVTLPNGTGLGHDDAADGLGDGVAPNRLTSVEDCDPFVGTPWHKHVAARLEPLA